MKNKHFYSFLIVIFTFITSSNVLAAPPNKAKVVKGKSSKPKKQSKKSSPTVLQSTPHPHSIELTSLLSPSNRALFGFDSPTPITFSQIPNFDNALSHINNNPIVKQLKCTHFNHFIDHIKKEESSHKEKATFTSIVLGINTSTIDTKDNAATAPKLTTQKCVVIVELSQTTPSLQKAVKSWKVASTNSNHSAKASFLNKQRLLFISGKKNLLKEEIQRLKKSGNSQPSDNKMLREHLGNFVSNQSLKGDKPLIWATTKLETKTSNVGQLSLMALPSLKRATLITDPAKMQKSEAIIAVETISPNDANQLKNKIDRMLKSPFVAQIASMAGIAKFLANLNLKQKGPFVYGEAKLSLIDQSKLQRMLNEMNSPTPQKQN